MSEFKEMKFWIGDDPELSRRVQEALFSAGYKWWERGAVVSNLSQHYFVTDEDGDILGNDAGNRCLYLEKDKEEINIDWMRTKKPETIELGGKRYIKAELEEALKHIKPVE